MTFFIYLSCLYIYAKKNAEQREERPSGPTVFIEQRAFIILSGQDQGPKVQIQDNKQQSAQYFRGERARSLQLVKTFSSSPNTAQVCNYSGFKSIFCGRW